LERRRSHNLESTRTKAASLGGRAAFEIQEAMGRLLGVNGIGFAQTSSLAAQGAQIEKLGAAHASRANFFHFLHHFAVQGENALDALAKAHLANREATFGAILARNHNALKGLDALFVAFFNLYLDTDRIARAEFGEVGALKFGSQTLHDGMNRHK
jgi:hypothetical protein